MAGIDIPIPELQTAIHQPTIKEISMIGEQDFFLGAQVLNLSKAMYVQDEKLLSETTNFQIFMTIMLSKDAGHSKECVIKVLSLLFPNSTVMFTPRSLLLNFGGQTANIDEDNFESLQTMWKQIFCLQETGNDAFNPANEEAKRIAEKIMRGRQRVAQLREKEGGSSTLTQYLSMLTIGLQVHLHDLLQLTMFQLYDLVERYMLHTNWDLYVKQRLAGAEGVQEPENWMKPIH